jgi:hypothetical protein
MKRREYFLAGISLISVGLAGCSEDTSTQTQTETTQTETVGTPLRKVTNSYTDVVTVSRARADWGGLAGDYDSAVVYLENQTNFEQLVKSQATFYDTNGQQVGTGSEERVIRPDPQAPIFISYPSDLPRQNPTFSITIQNVEEYTR